jgi:hypothetical protein
VPIFRSPIRDARAMAERGKTEHAAALLAELRTNDPSDLTVVHAERLLLSQIKATGQSGGIGHQLVGWVCVVLALAATASPLIAIGVYLDSFWAPEDPDAPLGVGFFAGMLAALAYFCCGFQYLFFRFWFWYLQAIAPLRRPLAEGKLALSMRLSDFEPLYSRARKHMYRGDA